jgi:hypothetical protein
MLEFLRHALLLTASVQGQLALLVRLQWVAGRRAAGVLSTAPFAVVVVPTPTRAASRRAVVELRRHFPLIEDNEQARACVRTIAGWKPLPAKPPRTRRSPRGV